MFDTMKVAKKIREARMAKNMTQMNLADAMGVSYQAVSNWERGNSMPDISKLEDLCRVLEISLTELLGAENRETAAIHKIIREPEPELTMEELSDIAPMLPPATVKAQARKSGGKKYNIKALAEVAVFLDDDMLEELLEDIQVDSLKDLAPVAPFLSSEMLDKLVRQAPMDDYDGIIALAPFLDEDTLDYLMKRGQGKPDRKLVEGLAAFMSDETLDHIARCCAEELDTAMLETLTPFMDDDTLDRVTDIYIQKGKVRELAGLYPFMEDKTMRKVAKALMAEGDMEGLKETAIFL